MTKEEDEMLSIYHGLKLEYMNHIFFLRGGVITKTDIVIVEFVFNK